MANKPHVRLNTQIQRDAPVVLRFNYGFGSTDEDESETEPNYEGMVRSFRGCMNQFQRDFQTRIEERNMELNIPAHIDYIQILFQGQFVTSQFYNNWYNEFGLQGIHFSKFNNEILFAVHDQERFSEFFTHINSFIAKESGEQPEAHYPGSIKFIKSFKLLTSSDMMQYQEVGQLMNIRIVDDFPLGNNNFEIILAALENRLQQQQLSFRYDESSRNLEIFNPTNAQIIEIVRNYDIIWSVTSSLATVVSPSEYNLPERAYGFDIVNADEDLPILGIVDTGISSETPLGGLLINDNRFNLTGTSPFTDSVDHGTGIAALAALGKRPYTQGYRGQVNADAKLLSIKILDARSGYLSQKEVLELLQQAKLSYPQIKIFVLTICYDNNKLENEDYSSYAFELDRFSHRNDCIVCICTGNNSAASLNNRTYDLNYFFEERTNLCSPAESMNNLIVGASAGSLRPGDFAGIATSKEFPTIYSRKGHINLSSFYSRNKLNKFHFKPDIIECGGDYEYIGPNRLIAAGGTASMEILSSNRTQSFTNEVGTSYSTPLVANIGAQIQKEYPNIRSQSIKALIINGASLDLIRFEGAHLPLLNKTAGHGVTNEKKSVFSDNNSITLLLEDTIEPEQVKIFPIHFPEYLTGQEIRKNRGILRITITLCFSFEPILNNQLTYCPIHIAFCLFKNQSGNEIQNTERNVRSLLKSNLRWSQSARHRGKPIPYTNTQKITLTINKQDLINEDHTFKLGVNCRINPQLLAGQSTPYNVAHPFSIALNIEENLKQEELTGRLYDEVIASNSIEQIVINEAIAEAEA